jgi:RNA polymerase sigma-70 factor, ECF subfamily
MSGSTDRRALPQLLRRAPALDAQAIDALFRECARDVHGYAISLLRDRSAAEDVTALAFERLYRARARLDPERGSARAWLFAIARNAALDELRRRGRSASRELEDLPLQDQASREELEHVERRIELRAALSALAPRDREVILLKFHGQLSNAELARALGVSTSNAGTRLHRALVQLREQSAAARCQEVA